jgi:hypothetical protein
MFNNPTSLFLLENKTEYITQTQNTLTNEHQANPHNLEPKEYEKLTIIKVNE